MKKWFVIFLIVFAVIVNGYEIFDDLTVDGDITPDTNSVSDIGADTLKYSRLYVDTIKSSIYMDSVNLTYILVDTLEAEYFTSGSVVIVSDYISGADSISATKFIGTGIDIDTIYGDYPDSLWVLAAIVDSIADLVDTTMLNDSIADLVDTAMLNDTLLNYLNAIADTGGFLSMDSLYVYNVIITTDTLNNVTEYVGQGEVSIWNNTVDSLFSYLSSNALGIFNYTNQTHDVYLKEDTLYVFGVDDTLKYDGVQLYTNKPIKTTRYMQADTGEFLNRIITNVGRIDTADLDTAYVLAGLYATRLRSPLSILDSLTVDGADIDSAYLRYIWDDGGRIDIIADTMYYTGGNDIRQYGDTDSTRIYIGYHTSTPEIKITHKDGENYATHRAIHDAIYSHDQNKMWGAYADRMYICDFEPYASDTACWIDTLKVIFYPDSFLVGDKSNHNIQMKLKSDVWRITDGTDSIMYNGAGDFLLSGSITMGGDTIHMTNGVIDGANEVISDTVSSSILYADDIVIKEINNNITMGIGINANIPDNSSVVIGDSAVYANGSGLKWSAIIGYKAGAKVTAGNELSFLGNNCGYSNTTGSGNTGLGRNALYNNTTGNNNMGFGPYALYKLSAGSYNVGIGRDAGAYLSNGTSSNTNPYGSVYIGSLTKASASAYDTNSIVIGKGAISKGSNTTVIGNTDTKETWLYGTVIPEYCFILGAKANDSIVPADVNTWYAVPWDTLTKNSPDGTCYTFAPNNDSTKILINRAGIYEALYFVPVEAQAVTNAGDIWVRLTKNNNEVPWSQGKIHDDFVADAAENIIVTTKIKCAVNDTIELEYKVDDVDLILKLDSDGFDLSGAAKIELRWLCSD